MSNTTKKSLLTLALLTLLPMQLAAQIAPSVRELVPASAPAGARLFVSGRGLADPNINVAFGSIGANVLQRNDRYIEVVVPSSAATGTVRVTLGSTLIKELPFTLASDVKYTVTTLAGGPQSQNNPLKHPWGTAVVLPDGRVAVADEQHHAIKLITPAGAVSVLAGNGSSGFDDGTGAAARFKDPRGITFDAQRRVLFVSDSGNHAIRQVALDGTVTTIAGRGKQGDDDGTSTEAEFKSPMGLTVGADGAIYVVDTKNNRIRKVLVTGVVTTFAGTGVKSRVDGALLSATFNEPRGIVASGNDFYVTDTKNNAIRKISNGQVTTVVSYPLTGDEDDPEDGIDGNPAVLKRPTGIAVDEAGDLIVSDSENDFVRKIRMSVTPPQLITIAGTGKNGWVDGPGAIAQFKDPVLLSMAGAIYMGDEDNDAIRVLCPEVRVGGLVSLTGAVAAGSEVRVFGTGFVPGATTVKLGNATATDVTWVSSTTLLVKLPETISGGSVSVTITTCGGTAGPVSFVVDNTPPVLTITNNGAPLPDNSMFKVPVIPVLTATDDIDPAPVVTATLNGLPFTSGTTVSADGFYTLVGTAEDSAGNRHQLTVRFTIDATPPVVEVFEGTTPFPAGFYFNRPVVIDATITDLTPTTKEPKIDGNDYVLKQSYAVEGTHAFSIRAVDALENETVKGPYAFTIDLTPPALTVTSHTEGQVVTEANITLVGGSDDALTVKVNGADATVDTTAKTFTIPFTLVEGENTITATGVDRATNVGTTVRKIVLDTRAPELTVAATPECTRAESLALHGTIADPNIDTITLKLGESTTNATIAGANWSATVPLGAEGSKSILIEATDKSGHVATRQIVVKVDRTAPVIEISESGAPFTAAFIGRAVSPFVRANDADAETTLTVTLDNAAFVSGSEIAAEGAHTLRVTAKDCAGNESAKEHAFTLDLTPPRFLSFNPASGAKLTQIPGALSGTTDPDAVEVRVKGITVAVANGAFSIPNIGFSDGINEHDLEVVDRVGHVGRGHHTLGVRTQKPLIDITEGGESLVSGTVYRRDVEPLVRVFEENVTFTATLNSASFNNGTRVTDNGAYTITATATDSVYNTTNTVTRTFSIDRSGPQVTIVSPAEGAVFEADRTEVRVTAGDSVSVSVNGIAATKNADNSWTAANVLLDFGDNTLVAYGQDAAGNRGSDDVTVSRGMPGPAIAITFPPDGFLTNRPKLDVTGRVFRPASSVAVVVPPAGSVSAAVDPAGVFKLNGATLVEGETTIAATASEGGKSTSASVKVIADFTPPKVRLLESGEPFADGASYPTQAVISGDATDKGAAIAFNLTIDGNPAASPTVVTAAGGHTAVITARDAAGNESRLERTFYVGSTAGGGCKLEAFDPPDQATINAQKVELIGRSGGAAGVKVNGIAARIYSGSFCATVELPQEGPNPVTIVCTDGNGNPVGDPVTITLHRVTNDPSVTIVAPVEDFVTHDETLTVTGTLGNGAISVDLNGKPATINGSSWSVTGVRLQDGINVLVAVAKNAAGRRAVASRRVTYIQDAPAIAISSPIPNYVTGISKVDVSGTYSNVDPASLAIEGLAGAVQATSWSDTTGEFIATNVALQSGENTIAVTGRSRTGRVARAEVIVKYLTTSPTISITDPTDNHYFPSSAGAQFRVSGTFGGAAEGSSVEVNGVLATLSGNTFAADVPFSTLAHGMTPVIARLAQPGGADGAFDSIRVFKLVDAPKVIETFPAANAIEVDPGAVVLVLFSAPMERDSVAAAFRLENATGTPVNGKTYLDKDVLTFAPATTLTPGERYTIKVSTGAKDLAGQSLESAVANAFTIATTAPSTAPVLTTASGRFCGNLIDVVGTSVPGARVRLDYGSIFFTTTASSTGAFSYKVPLSGQAGYHVIRVRTLGADGSLSPWVELKLNVDCTGPRVVSASYDRPLNKLTINFSKDIKAETLTTGATGSVQLVMTDGRIVGGTISLAGAVATMTPAENLGGSTFTLKVSTAVEDTQSRKLEFPHTQLFAFGSDDPQPGDGRGFITGEVYDATTGRPLAGAEITIEAPISAFSGTPRVATLSTATTQAVTMITDARGRYGERFPEGAHTIKASANGYTTVWRQIIVPAGAGVIPIDIRLTRRGEAKTIAAGATTLTHGGTNAVTRKAELTIPAGAVTSGVTVTLTSSGAQSLAGLLPLGWSPLASAEIASSANSLGASTLAFDVPQSELTQSAQTLTAVRYDDMRDEWRVVAAVVNVAGGKATFDAATPGAYALVYADRAAGLVTPPAPSAGAPLQGVADPCADGSCPAMVAKSFPLNPEVVLPTGSTVATLNIEGTSAHKYPSGTAVQAYIDEELRLADGGRELDPPFATDLLLYRDLAGSTGVAAFNLAPSPRAAEVFLEVGFDHIRILPYPGRLDRGTLVGPEGGRVPADDKVSVEIPTGATPTELRATASSIADATSLGPIAGYTIVGGLQLTLQRVGEEAPADPDASGIAPVELARPARATFTVDPAQLGANPQLILVELLDQTPFGNRMFRLAAEMTAIDAGRWTTKSIDRDVLPVDGIIREGRYLLLAAQSPIAFAKGIVRIGAGGPAAANARVTTPGLGVGDLTRLTGIFNIPVPSAPAAPFSLVPRTVSQGDGAAYVHASAPAAATIVNVGDLVIVAQPPQVSTTIPANNATDVAVTTSVEVTLTPGIDPSSVNAGTLTVIDSTTGAQVTGGTVTAIGAVGVRWNLPAGEGLRQGTRYVAALSPNLRGINGTPLGQAYTFSFTTVSVFTNSELHPERIRITIPDANGVSKVIGDAGALKAGWIGIPVRRGTDFLTRYSATAGSDGSFSVDIGTNARDRVSITDAIDLRVLNNNGALAAIIPLTPFISEDKRAFVATPTTAIDITTADGVRVVVPAGAFAVPTRIDVTLATPAAFAAVPRFNDELKLAGAVNVKFAGRAKKPLELVIPVEAGTDLTRPHFLGILGTSSRGPGIMAVDTLFAVDGKLSTMRPPTAQNNFRTLDLSIGTKHVSRGNDPKDYTARVIDEGIYAALDMRDTANSNGMVWAFCDGIAQAVELLWDTMYSMFVGHRYVSESYGRVAFPVPGGTQFTVTAVDPATALVAWERTYNALPVGDPNVGTAIGTPTTDFNGPHPVFGSPFRIESTEAPPVGVTIEVIRGIEMTLDGSGNLNVTGTGSMTAATQVSGLHIASGELRGPQALPMSFPGVEAGDALVFLIDEEEVDPAAPLSIVFNEAIDQGAATSEDEVSEHLKTLIKLEQVPDGSAPPIDLIKNARLLLDSGNRRLTILLPSPLARDANFRLTLKIDIQDRSGNGLKLGQAGEPNAAGVATPIGPLPQPMVLRFSTRKPAGGLSKFTLRQRDGAEFGQIREILKYDNLLFATALDGGILAYDLSDPATLDDTSTDKPKPIGMVPGKDTDSMNPITHFWTLAIDHHGRVISGGVTPLAGVIRTYRVEDFINAKENPDDCLGSIDYTVCKQTSSSIVSQTPGSSTAVGIASLLVITDRVEGYPRKLRLVVGDEKPQLYTGQELMDAFASGASTDVGNGLRRFNPEIPATWAKYRLQRITIENVTLGLRWSADAKAESTGVTLGKAKFTDVVARPTDQMRVLFNKTAHAVIALFGFGIGVYDVNAIESNDHKFQAFDDVDRPKELVMQKGNAWGDLGPPPASIGDIKYSPESEILSLPGDALRVYTLDGKKGVVEFHIGLPDDISRAGEILFTVGNPRFDALKPAVLAANPGAIVRFNSAAIYSNPDTEKRYLMVPALDYGLFAVEVGGTPLSAASFADVVWIPNGAYAIRVIERTNLAMVIDGLGYGLLVDLSRVDERSVSSTGIFPTAAAALSSGTQDPRILWKSEYPVAFGSGFIPPVVDGETGLMYTADLLSRDMRVTSAIDPSIRVVADLGHGQLKEVGSVVPLGIEPPAGVLQCDDAATNVDCRASLAAFRIEAKLPGSMTESVVSLPMAIESERIAGIDTPQMPEPYPVSHIRHLMRPGSGGGVDSRYDGSQVELRRVLDIPALPKLRFQRGWNRFLSNWIVAIADPRAAKDFAWPSGVDPETAAECFSCKRPLYLASEPDDIFEIYSNGRFFTIRPEMIAAGPYGFMAQDKRMTTRITTIPGDLVRPSDGASDVDKIAAKNLPTGGTEEEGPVAVNTGEVVQSAVDLQVNGRGLDFMLQRHYSSAIAHVGPFGRNFDSPLFARVQYLPNGDVAFYDGSGRRDIFTGGTTAPDGVFLDMRRDAFGNLSVIYPDNTRLHFDSIGRLSKITDRNTTKTDGSDGNAMHFVYDARGRLAAVIDPTSQRPVSFKYYETGSCPSCIEKVRDHDGREVTYTYDANGRLERVEGPDPASASSAMPSTTYEWGPTATVGTKAQLYASGQVKAERDGLSRTVWSVLYDGSHPWSAKTLTSGGGTWTFNLSSDNTTVIDPNAHTNTYNRDATARITSVVEPGGATTTYGYDTGRLASITRPMGDKTVYGYGGGDRRAMLNITSITEHPRPGTPEAVAGMTRQTTIGYGPANLPTSITRPDGTSSSMVRDARGNPTSATDATGNTITYGFDVRGLLQSHTNPRTGASTYGYVTSGVKTGYLASITTPDGTTTVDVDNRGNPKTVTALGGSVTQFVVNKLDQMEHETNADSSVRLKYDAAGNLVTQEIKAGTDPVTGTPIYSMTSFVTDEVDRLRTRTENGLTTTYTYDAAWNLKTITRPGEVPVTYVYDPRNRAQQILDGSRVSTLQYDDGGAYQLMTNARGKTTTFSVNGFGEQVGEIDPAGTSTVESKDAAGRPVDVRVVKKQGADTFVLRWSTYEYDALGRVTRQVRKLFTSPLLLPATGDPAGAIDVVTRTIYDDAARTVTEIDPRGVTTITQLDADGRAMRVTDGAGNVVEYEYDAKGNRKTETRIDKRPDGTTETHKTSLVYDERDQLITVLDEKGEVLAAYGYDERGNRVAEFDPDGNATEMQYDLRGNLSKAIDAEGRETVYQYDVNGRLEFVRDANGNKTSFTYDDRGNVIEERRADGATWTFTYDENDNRKSVTDANGTVTTFTYDDNDRMVSKTINRATDVLGPETVTYTYDDLGRIIAAETSEGVKTAAVFDSLDRGLREEIQIGSGPRRVVERQFDLAGNVTTIGYPSGLSVTHTIDPLERIAAITRSGASAPVVTYADTGERLTSRTLMNGVTTTVGYDDRLRLSTIEDRLGEAVMRNVRYDRSPAGRKRMIDRPDLGKRWRYLYNRNSAITDETIERTDTEVNPLLNFTSYFVDPVLNYRRINRINQTFGLASTSSTEATVNQRNQYATFGNLTLAHDRNGNLTRMDARTMRYDAENHMSRLTLPDGTIVDNTYDGSGRKVQEKTTKGSSVAVRQYVLNGNGVLEEYVDGTLAARYIRGRGIDEIVQAEIGGETFFPLQDELGNVDRITGTAGNTLERYEYRGYGEHSIFDAAGARRNASAYGWRLLFQGRPYDSASDSYDFRARTLWPELGRFGQEDPAGPVDSLNLQQALGGAFVENTDPLGLKIQLVGKNYVDDLNLLKRALYNPLAADELALGKDRAKGRFWVVFKTNRRAFVSKAIPDPSTYLSDLKSQSMPMPTDGRVFEEKLADMIDHEPIVEYETGVSAKRNSDAPFSWFKRWRTFDQFAGEHGGAFTLEPHETPTGNVHVLVNPAFLVPGGKNYWLSVAESNYGITFDPEITVIHEFGHAMAYVKAKTSYFHVWSVEFENQIRARRKERHFRTSEDPKNTSPSTLKPMKRPKP